VEGRLMLGVAELTKIITHYDRSAFRLEVLDLYDVGTDGGDVARYLRGDREPDPERKGPWLAQLRAERNSGKRAQRVHVLPSPLSDYLRYECEWGYVPNVEAGEDIRILDLAENPCPAEVNIGHDFWLLDDTLVIRMHYDAAGRYLGAETLPSSALPRYQAA